MRPDLQRRIQRRGWDIAADCYERYWGRQLQPAIDGLLTAADLRPGEDVIDVAAGTGMVTLPAAEAVVPGGRVLATDLSPRMLAELRDRADRRDIANVEVACRGAEDLDADAAFDVALCSLGLMYVPDPAAAAGALHDSVRPGGRVAVSVWGERRNCGWAAVFPIVDARVSSDVCPLFFALGAPGALTALLARAGLVDVAETRLAVDLPYRGPSEALGAAFLGGPVALAASRFAPDVLERAYAEYLDSIAGFRDGHGYRVPGEFVIATGRRTGTESPSQPPTTTREEHQP